MNLSICITLKNRATFMQGKLEELLAMNYDPQLLEICVTDGGSTDGIVEVLKSFAGQFGRIKYAISDRSVLPFKVASNNPACDINAQIMNVASYNMCVRTDAEVRFQNRDSLQLIKYWLGEKRKALSFDCYRLKPGIVPELFTMPEEDDVFRRSRDAFFCVAFDRREFEKHGGVEELFTQGFAGEDSQWHWYWRRFQMVKYAPIEHSVLHLDHGQVDTPEMRRLRNAITIPLFKKMKFGVVPPNYGNQAWRRPEMIREVQTW